MKRVLMFISVFMIFINAKAYQIEWGRNVTITKPVFEDLYIAGGTVRLNAPVYGDVVVAGGTIYINDTISNDLLIAGGTVYITGYVEDDIRCAGGEIHIQNSIGGDLVVTGGNITIDHAATIGGGLVIGGGEATVNAVIHGNVKAGGGKFTFNGIAEKNFECKSQQLDINGIVLGDAVLAARNLQVGRNASFLNNVRFWTKDQKLDFSKNVHNGSRPVYDPSLKVESDNWYYLGHSTILGLIWYLGVVFLFIVLIQYLFAKTFNKAGSTFSHSLWKSLGRGLLFFIGVPLVALLLIVTIIGIPFGLLVILSYVGLIILATIITAIVIANWYNSRFHQQWNYWRLVLSSLALFILLKIISFTPFFGWMIMIIIASMAFGSLLRNIDWKGKSKMAMQ